MRDKELGYDADLAATVEATHICALCAIEIDLALCLRVSTYLSRNLIEWMK